MKKWLIAILLFTSVSAKSQLQFFGVQKDSIIVPAQLSGTPFGSTQFDSPATTYDVSKMFDNNLTTEFISNDATNGYGGLDLGSVKTLTKISIYPLTGFESRCAALIVEGSNTNSTSGYTTMYTFTGNPATGTYTDYTISGSYRWVRIRNPSDNVTVVELQIWGY